MKRIKRLIYYFFLGIKTISNNKVAILIIFSFAIMLINKTFCYKEELKEYKYNEMTSYKEYKKISTESKYYYNNTDNNNNDNSKNIAAEDLVNCLNKKIELNEINSELKESINKINSLFNESNNYFSYLYKDLYTGFTVSYNEDAPIFTASTIKAPAMIYIYELASKKEIDLTEELTYTSNFYKGGSGLLKDKPFNTKYNIDTLVKYSIHASDNIAYSMLMDRYGRENILKFWQEKGTKNIYTLNTIWGETSAKDASIYMQELYDFYKRDNEYGEKLMNYFKTAEWKIITNKDGEHNTANKGGWSNETFHDIAIVFEENPYILVVMSNSGNDYNDYTYLFNKASILTGELHEKYWKYKINECKDIKQY